MGSKLQAKSVIWIVNFAGFIFVTNFQRCGCFPLFVNILLFCSDASAVSGQRQGDMERYHERYEETRLRLRAGKRSNSIVI